MAAGHSAERAPWYRSRTGLVLLGFLAIAGFFLTTEHRAHLLGFLVQWPTILTLAMFPVLVWMYVRLACQEERAALVQFGEA